MVQEGRLELQEMVWDLLIFTASAQYLRAPLDANHVTAAELELQMREACTLVGTQGTEQEVGEE